MACPHWHLACLVAIAPCAFTAARNDRLTAAGQWIRRVGQRDLARLRAPWDPLAGRYRASDAGPRRQVMGLVGAAGVAGLPGAASARAAQVRVSGMINWAAGTVMRMPVSDGLQPKLTAPAYRFLASSEQIGSSPRPRRLPEATVWEPLPMPVLVAFAWRLRGGVKFPGSWPTPCPA